MYNPQYISLPNDIYREAVNTAKSYYAMLRRRDEIESEIIGASPVSDGQPHGTTPSDVTGSKAERILLRQAENDRKIKAVEQAWATMTEPFQRKFIQLNFFEDIHMFNINLPPSLRTMKQWRKIFLLRLAENLNEI